MAMLSALLSFVSGDNQLNYHCGYDLSFLAVQNSSIGDLVTHSLTDSVTVLY